MSPPLAACVFVAFIYWLFRRYSKESGPISSGLWIPFLWFGINATRALGHWFSSGIEAAEAADFTQGSFIDRTAYLVLIAGGILVLARRRIAWPHFIHNCRWLIVLYGYYLAATFWSDFTFVAFKRWFKDAGDIVMVLIILTEKDPVEAIRAVCVRSFYLLIPLSVLVIKWYPTIGRYTHRYTYQTFYSGITSNKNALGLLAMLGGFFLLWQIVDVYRHRGQRLTLRNVWPDLIVLSMCLWLMNLAGCATATVCFILGTSIFFFARLAWVKANLRSFALSVVGVALLMAAFSVSPGLRSVITGVLGRDATLTDRTLIWEMVMESGSNPIIGSGFESFWLTDKGNKVVEEFHVNYAHNGYLERYLHTGCIGVLLLLLVMYAAGGNATSQCSSGRVVGYLFMSLFWSGLMFNYTESSFGRSNVFGLLFSLMAAYDPVFPATAENVRSEMSLGRNPGFSPELPALSESHNRVTDPTC